MLRRDLIKSSSILALAGAVVNACGSTQVNAVNVDLATAQAWASEIVPLIISDANIVLAIASVSPTLKTQITITENALSSVYTTFQGLSTGSTTTQQVVSTLITGASALFADVNGVTGVVPPDIAAGIQVGLTILAAFASTFTVSPVKVVVPPIPASLHAASMKAKLTSKVK